MKKKTLLLVALCTATLTLVACGSKETNTDATATGTPAPTQSVTDNVTDDATDTTVTETPEVTEPTITETPAETKPTVAPIEPETEVPTPTPTPTEAPTPTPPEAPTPTEAPKELTLAEKYAIEYPFMEVEIFENVTIDDSMNDIFTGYLIYYKNNSNESYNNGFGVLKPGVGFYTRSTASNYDALMADAYKEYGTVSPTSDTSTYLREDELQVCEDENCLFTSYDECSLTDEYCYITFFNADGKPVYYLRGFRNEVKRVNNQLHVSTSGLSDVDWATAKIVYQVSE